MTTMGQLQEALTSNLTSPLIAKAIDRNLIDVVRREDPWETFFPTTGWDTDQYFWDQRTNIPTPQAVVEAPPTTGTGSVAASASTYAQNKFPIKHYQSNGDLAEFANRVSNVALDAGSLMAAELKQHARAMRYYRTVCSLFGSAAATPDAAQNSNVGSWRPQWDGIDRQIAIGNVINAAAGIDGTVALADFDGLVDTVRQVTANELPADQFAFILTNPMLSEVNRLLITGQRLITQTIMRPMRGNLPAGKPVVITPGGIECDSYRGIPILVTSFLSHTALGAMSAITLTENSSVSGSQAGTIGTAALFYQVVAITQQGKTAACAQGTVTPGAGTSAIDITFTTPTPTDINGNAVPILAYEVYKSHTTGVATLYGIVGATDASDAAVTKIRDGGTYLAANPASNSALGSTGYNGLVNSGHGTANAEGDGTRRCHTDTSAEDVYLVSRNPEFMLMPQVTDMETKLLAQVNARSLQYAVIGDCTLALRYGSFAAKLQLAKNH